MENVIKALRDFGRFRELKDLLPERQEQLSEEKYSLREANLRCAQAKWELDKLEKGGFFQQLLSRQEEKKEKYNREYREAQAQAYALRLAAEQMERELEALQQEYMALSDSWGAYLRSKEAYLTDGADGQLLAQKEIPVLAAIAAKEIRGCLDDLEEARPWMQADVRTTRINPDSRKLEYLGNARTHAEIALALLKQMPEGSVAIPAYLRSPDGYIMGVSMAYKQLDRLGLAQEQLHGLRSQLKDM